MNVVSGSGAYFLSTLRYQNIGLPIIVETFPGSATAIWDPIQNPREFVWSTTSLVIAPSSGSNSIILQTVFTGTPRICNNTQLLRARNGNFSAQFGIFANCTSLPNCSPNPPFSDTYLFQYNSNAKAGGLDLPMQWHLCHPLQNDASIQAIKAWGIFTGSTNSIITICDDGLNPNHPEFIGKVARQHIRPQNEIYWDNHGTQAAGIAAAAANGRGTVGVDPNARIISLFLEGEISVSSLYFATDPDPYARVTNHSNGFGGNINPQTGNWFANYQLPLAKSYANAYMNNKVTCAGMANQGVSPKDGPIAYPAGFRTCLAVGATNSFGKRQAYSQIGSHIDVVAPGDIMLSPIAYPSGTFQYGRGADIALAANENDIRSYAYIDGTSAATPVVAGVASLMIGYAREGAEKYIFPSNLFGLYNDDVENIIKLSADKMPIDDQNPQPYSRNNYLYDYRNDYVGHGKVNAYRALWYVKKGKVFHEDQPVNVNDATYQDIPLHSTRIEFKEVFVSPHKSIRSPATLVRIHDVRQRVTFRAMNILNAKVWGRGSMMRESGYSWYDTATTEIGTRSALLQAHQGVGWCNPVVDPNGASVSNTSALLQTYVYEVLNSSGQPTGEWIPCKPSDVRFYYTVFDVPNDPPDINATPKALVNLTHNAYQYTHGETTQNVKMIKKPQTELIEVDANAPNPFNDLTWLSFTLRQPSFLDIEVFDMLGQKVLDHHHSFYESGNFSTSLSASGLRTGRYNVRFRTTTTSGESAIKILPVSVVK